METEQDVTRADAQMPVPPPLSMAAQAPSEPPPLPAAFVHPPPEGEEPVGRAARKPRLWPLVVVTKVTPVVVVVAATMGHLALGVLTGSGLDHNLHTTPVGMTASVLFSHGAIILVALGAAWVSSRPWRERLGLVRPCLRWRTLVMFLLGTMVIGTFEMFVLSLLFRAPSQGLLDILNLQQSFSGLSLGFGVLVLGGFVGFAEELFFRGFLQTRLLRRWKPLPAFLVVNLLFGLAHVDPHHAVATFIFGFWLSYLAWRTHSVWPAVVCHAGFNAVAIILSSFGSHLPPGTTYADILAGTGTVELAWNGLSLAGLGVSVWMLARTRLPAEPVIG